ncbi:MAG: isoaspartyl peptidase/L-asparaginase family protein [Caulobacter sp.]
MSEPSTRGRWAVIVHGGARTIAPELEPRHQEGCRAAVEAAMAVLRVGGPALDAVEAAVRVLEDDPTFNAATGSVTNSDGEVECDAALMDGRDLAVGAVGAVRGVRNPVSLARALLNDEAVLLVGAGAERFAAQIGAPVSLVRQSAASTQGGCDTVGCVALDMNGDLAAGTSTGGLEGSRPGRVGDCPLPGCGLYAENGVGGVSLSGEGEAIMRVGMAAWVMRAMQFNTPQEAAKTGFERLAKVGGEAGAIAIDADGRIGWMHNSRNFAVAYASHDQAPCAFTNQIDDPQMRLRP